MKVSIVIIEYHSLNELQKCVDSVSRVFDIEKEIIISSNSCYSEQRQKELEHCFLSNSICTVKWCFNERNGGFAYAMNEGLAIATGDFLAICNPDCLLLDNMDSMCDFLDKHPEIGAIGPKMVDEEGIIQDTARNYVSLQSFIWRQLMRLVTKRESLTYKSMDYDKVQTVDWLVGAFIMVSRKAYEMTGGLDEGYFMYAEDLDWCTRIRKCGFEVVYFPKVKLQYKGTRSARRNMGSAKVFLKSHLRYWKKFGFFCGYPERNTLMSI